MECFIGNFDGCDSLAISCSKCASSKSENRKVMLQILHLVSRTFSMSILYFVLRTFSVSACSLRL
ncbi:MAG: hypothetical protein ABF652_24370, partial [Clostridium beijerinckii]